MRFDCYTNEEDLFVNTVVKVWNILPDKVVSVSSVSCFKRHLDGFWCDRDLYYNYKSDI